MDDDFFAELRADWRRPSVDLERLRRQNQRRRRLAAFYDLLSLVGALGVAPLALWFAWRAIVALDPISAVGALALLVAAPLMVLEYVELRRARRIRYDDTPRGVLLQARDQALHARRQMRGCRWTAAILGLAALAVLLIALSGNASFAAVLPIAGAWGFAAVSLWAWQILKSARAEREAEICEVLLNQAPPVLYEIYDRYDRLSEKRDALQRYEAFLLKLTGSAD